MTIRKVLLGTTALIGAGLLGVSAPVAVQAAEIKPIGALDIGIGGFARWYGIYGALGGKQQRRQIQNQDMRTDTEVFVYATGKDEATGLDYGARIEIESDTNTTGNTDEAYVFIGSATGSSGFGQFRFGDEDGGSDLQKVGAFTFAAGSGGIDGVGPIDLGSTVAGPNSGDSTKIIYITPTIAGFNAIVSYTNDVSTSGTDTLPGTQNAGSVVNDLFEGGIAWRGSFGSVSSVASVVGHYGSFNNGNTIGTDGGNNGSGETWKVYGGATVSVSGISFGGGIGTGQGIVPTNAGAAAFDRGSDYSWFNLGVGTKIGPANVSLTYGQVFDGEQGSTARSREPWEVVLSADVGIAPGLAVTGDLAYFNVSGDGCGEAGAVANACGVTDDGVLGIVGVRVAF